jgi:integrase
MAYRIDRVDLRARMVRRDPYWLRLTSGRYLGFRRMSAGAPGTWLARCHDGTKYVWQALGDFAAQPENKRYDAAKAAAEQWFAHRDGGGATRPPTVRAACEAYVDRLRVLNSVAAASDAAGRFARLVYNDPVANVNLGQLTPADCGDWKRRVLAKGGTRSSYNRNSTPLRAALNLALEHRHVASNVAWVAELKPLKRASNRRTLYMDVQQRRRLIDHASDEARALLKSLALMPLRPGEIANLQVEHFDPQQQSLTLVGKTEERRVPLSRAAAMHFTECARGKLASAWLVSRAHGGQWKKEAWRDAVKDAAIKAGLPEETVAYTLRHSVITDLVIGCLDLFTVAKLAGTSIAMIEKHYGHLQRENARAALEKLAVG